MLHARAARAANVDSTGRKQRKNLLASSTCSICSCVRSTYINEFVAAAVAAVVFMVVVFALLSFCVWMRFAARAACTRAAMHRAGHLWSQCGLAEACASRLSSHITKTQALLNNTRNMSTQHIINRLCLSNFTHSSVL